MSLKRGKRVKLVGNLNKHGVILTVGTLDGKPWFKVIWDDDTDSSHYANDLIEVSARVDNRVYGTTNGPVIQAGDIEGGVHLNFDRD